MSHVEIWGKGVRWEWNFEGITAVWVLARLFVGQPLAALHGGFERDRLHHNPVRWDHILIPAVSELSRTVLRMDEWFDGLTKT